MQKIKTVGETPSLSLENLKANPVLARILPIVVALTVGAAVVMPFYFARREVIKETNEVIRLIRTHDMPALLAMMEQFDRVLRSGVFYPRWYPDWNNGYGIPTGNFYPPGLFYLTSLINVVMRDWVHTLFILCALSLAGAGLALYHLARQFFGRPASAAAALVYILLPMHQLDLYWRGAIPQFFGYLMLPLIFYFAYRLGGQGRLRDYAAVGLLHGAYLMTHLPVAYLFTYVLAFYAVLWAARERDLKIMFRLAGGLSVAFLLSAIYWLPAAIEGRNLYDWASELFPYHYVYITLLPAKNQFDKLINYTFILTALALIAVIVVLRQVKGGDKNPAWTQVRMWVVLGVATIFMSTSFSIYISQLIPKIQVAVPPFRWLAITSMFTALLIGACVERWRDLTELKPAQMWACRVALGAVVALNLWLTVQGVIVGAFINPSFLPTAKFMDPSFLPKEATRPDHLPDTELAILEPEGGAIEVMRWEPTYRAVSVNTDTPATLRLKTYKFPGWVARVDGKAVPLLGDQDGIQQVELSPGIHKVETSFENTWPRTAGTVISAVAFLAIIGLAMAPGWRQRAPAQEQPEGVAIKRVSRMALIVGVAAIALAVLAFITLRSGSKDASGPNPSGSPVTPVGGVEGEDARLSVTGAKAINVAVDRDAFNELIGALSSRDAQKVDALIQSGKVFSVENNTRVRVLEKQSSIVKVRVLEGERLMVEGWVLEGWVR